VSEETSFRDLRDGDTYVPPLRKYPFFLANRSAATRHRASLATLLSHRRGFVRLLVSVSKCRGNLAWILVRKTRSIASRDSSPRPSRRAFNANESVLAFAKIAKTHSPASPPPPVRAAAFLHSAIFKFTPQLAQRRARINAVESTRADSIRRSTPRSSPRNGARVGIEDII